MWRRTRDEYLPIIPRKAGPPPAGEPSPARDRSRTRALVAIGLAAGLFLVGSVGAFAFLSGDNAPDKKGRVVVAATATRSPSRTPAPPTIEASETSLPAREPGLALVEPTSVLRAPQRSLGTRSTPTARPAGTPITAVLGAAAQPPPPSATAVVAAPATLPTGTPIPAQTATLNPTATVTAISTPAATMTPVPTATMTPVPTATMTPVPTATATPSPEPTATPTPPPTATSEPTLIPKATPPGHGPPDLPPILN